MQSLHSNGSAQSTGYYHQSLAADSSVSHHLSPPSRPLPLQQDPMRNTEYHRAYTQEEQEEEDDSLNEDEEEEEGDGEANYDSQDEDHIEPGMKRKKHPTTKTGKKLNPAGMGGASRDARRESSSEVGKRMKHRSEGKSEDHNEHTDDQIEPYRPYTADSYNAAAEESNSSQKKRVKTPRACDSCRFKKIRCDALAGSETQICQHCESHRLDCTWILPITETRFKRSKARVKEFAADGTPIVPTPKKVPTGPSKAKLRKAAIAAQKEIELREEEVRERAAMVLEAAARAHQEEEDRMREMEIEREREMEQRHQHHQYHLQQQQQAHAQQQQHYHTTLHNSYSAYNNPTMPLATSSSIPRLDATSSVPLYSYPHSSQQQVQQQQQQQYQARPTYSQPPHLQLSSSTLPPLRSSHSSPSESSGSSNLLLPRKEARLVGNTSIAHLMHSTSTFPIERMGPVDVKYAQSLTVGEGGDGYIRVVSDGDAVAEEYWSGGSNGFASAGGDGGAIQGIERGTMEKLINYYFKYHSPHFPIVSRADFLSAVTPSPLLFNALCGISALSHHVPPSILRTIKGTIRSTLREEDILDNSSIVNVQALLIYAYSLELEKGPASSKSWNILGLAIRMAQDLGLHRKMNDGAGQSETDNVELRRRVFGGCVVADRWISAIYGAPMLIDLADCDCLLPSIYDIRPNTTFDAEQRPYLFNSALISLSILLGRILKSVYSPTGIMTLTTTDADQLIEDLASWFTGLPDELRFDDAASSSPAAGFLHLLYIPVRFLITRPFMRISFQLPERFAHITIGVDKWTKLDCESRAAIEWVDKNESCLEGWFVGIYAFFISSLIQYHSHIRRRDDQSLATLKLARDTMQRLVVPDGECHVRAKIAEITNLLYHTACSVGKWAPVSAAGQAPVNMTVILNPTMGVKAREQDWTLKYKAEGKYFVTEREASPNDPPNNLVRSSHSAPASNAPSPYSTSLRSTHEKTGGPLGEETMGASNDNEAGSEAFEATFNHSSYPIPVQPQQHPVQRQTVVASALAAARISNMANSVLDAALDPPSSAPPILTAHDQYLDPPSSMNFNPSLNGMNGMNGDTLYSLGLGGGGMNGDPTMLGMTPDVLFDWDQWSTYFSSQGGPSHFTV